ncbi:MAG TPA: Do family serine endopeptidase [Pseudolabrys sp.]|nr:Do family serine endopeptidase [Pseudolabrys sp.]
MSDHHSFERDKRKFPSGRRVALLGSAAVLGVAVLAGGPGHFNFGPAPATAQTTNLSEKASAAKAPVGFADLVAKVKPAVISVRVRIDEPATTGMNSSDNGMQSPPGSPMEKFFRQFGRNLPHRKQIITGEGSGFFISADGYAVTNNHVVDHADTVQVKTDDGTIYKAKVIGTDPKTDLALIKVDSDKTFPYVKFADKAPRVGDWVVAVGNPFGLGGTVTAGIISARGRDIGSGPYDDYIQIDAPINKGNSGGPAFNVDGNVIGVNTAIFSPSGGSVGIGFDIPASTAKNVIAQLKEHGKIVRAYMGVTVQPVSAGIAESLGLKKAQGAIVDNTQANSPAAKAGIVAGDVITKVNDDPVKDSRDLARTIGNMKPDSSVKVTLLHDGDMKTITMTLAKMPSQQQTASNEQNENQNDNGAQQSGVPHLGLRVAPANDVAGAGGKGVVVLGVNPDGPAAQQGFRAGDVILDVGGKSVGKASDVSKALKEAKDSGKHAVLMRVKTADATRFIAVPLNKAS